MENKKTADFETVSFDSQYNRSIEQPNPDQWLLDHFAGLAMQATLINDELRMALIQDSRKIDGISVNDYIAIDAYEMAKAMLKARKEVNNG